MTGNLFSTVAKSFNLPTAACTLSRRSCMSAWTRLPDRARPAALPTFSPVGEHIVLSKGYSVGEPPRACVITDEWG